jgi:hypothetical protein
MSIHQLHSSTHSLRTQYLIERNYFPHLGGDILEQPIGEFIHVPRQHPTNVIWGKPIFPSLPMSLLELLQSTHDHYMFIRHLVNRDQIQLGSSYHKSICQFQTNSLPSWHILTSLQTRQLAPHIYHVSFKEGVLQNEVHLINFT